MQSNIIKIGNSHGVRIPKPFLEECGLSDEIEINIIDNGIMITSPNHPRKDWDKAFKDMKQNNDDNLVDELLTHSDWDDKEWEWK